MPLTATSAPLRRLTAAIVLAFALALGGQLALAGPAAAHADLVSSSPSDGAVLASEPARVTLLFSEEVTLRLSSVKVVGPDGRRVDSGTPQAAGSGEDGLTVGLTADQQQGTFVLDWLATAADDGHATSGTLTFSVGAPSRAAAATGFAAPDRVTDAVLDLAIWAGLAGLALLVGCAAIRLHCLPAVTDAGTDAGADAPFAADLRWPATLGWAALLAGTLVQLFSYGPSTQRESLAHIMDRSLLSATLSTHEGHTLVARIILLALIAAVGEIVLRRVAGVVSVVAATVLTLALAATWSEISHASSGSLVPLALAVTTLHVTAMAVWAGGLFTIAVLLTRATRAERAAPAPRRTRADVGPDLGSTTARFSRLALCSVAVLAATGLYQAFREVGSFAALTGTPYGRLLLVKTAVFLLVIAIAAWSRTLVSRARERSSVALRRSILFELAGVTAVLVVTVLLIGNAPARDARKAQVTGTGTGTVAAQRR
ncbi:copper resistance CopC/CopD family protein [Streptacidiphilus sp. N1-3]|uniref:Copper resistance CopC/CopD family protein n=1 Tax=Streptacidiphilus alkalitolerans TaxID=3342712 RepID=A0ABV6X1F6_9ACTN